MKDIFNEDLPYITHFVAFHRFLRRPQILLTFIRNLTLTKGNVRERSYPSLSNRVQIIPYF